jgi:hypothetical protein
LGYILGDFFTDSSGHPADISPKVHFSIIAVFLETTSHIIQVDCLDWFPRENGAKHQTDFYELVCQQGPML